MAKDTKKKSGFLKGAGGFTGSSAIYDLLLNQGQGITDIGKALLGLKDGGNGKWIQKVNKSIKERGTEGKCTPITKPGCTGRAKALAKTFKKMAKKRKNA